MKKHKIIIALIILIGLYVLVSVLRTNSQPGLRIGVITALTGDVAYWGQSALAGIELAKVDFAKNGINVDVIVEDAQLDPSKALSAAQKLVNIDKVQAIYSEFNPVAIAVSSFLSDKDIAEIYDAAPTSPLASSQNFFKSYLNYEESCSQTARFLKDKGIKRVGVLKMNIEFGELCAKGIRDVYGDDAVVESYNPGASDIRSQLVKLRAANVEAVFNGAYQPATLLTVKTMRELRMNQVFVALRETITPDVLPEYSNRLEDSILFGLPSVSADLIARIRSEVPNAKIVDENAAALAYMHIKQLGMALNKCDKNIRCVTNEIANSEAYDETGFEGFHDRVASFTTKIEEFKGGRFVMVK